MKVRSTTAWLSTGAVLAALTALELAAAGVTATGAQAVGAQVFGAATVVGERVAPGNDVFVHVPGGGRVGERAA